MDSLLQMVLAISVASSSKRPIEAIYVVQDGKFVFLNPQTETFSGYTREELIGRPFTELIHPDDREMVIANHQRRLRGEKFPHIYFHRIIDRQGNVKWGDVNAAMIQWKGRPAALIFLTDITEQKETEEALQRSDEALRFAHQCDFGGPDSDG